MRRICGNVCERRGTNTQFFVEKPEAKRLLGILSAAPQGNIKELNGRL